MKATLVLIYKVLGASRLADGFSKGPVYDSGAVVAHLTENVDKAWEHVDRANALVGLLLGSFKGQRLGSEDQVEKPESDLVSREMAIERERRLKEHGSGVFLTISAAKDVGEPLLNATRLMGRDRSGCHRQKPAPHVTRSVDKRNPSCRSTVSSRQRRTSDQKGRTSCVSARGAASLRRGL